MDRFISGFHVTTLVLTKDKPRRFLMQPKEKDAEADEEFEGYWPSEKFLKTDMRLGPEGLKYQVRFQSFADTYSIESDKKKPNSEMKNEFRKAYLADSKREKLVKEMKSRKIDR